MDNTQTSWYSQKRVCMKEKQRLCMEKSTHRGEDIQRSVREEEYTRRELHTDQYRWWSVHIEECTHGGVYTWRSVYMEEYTHGGMYTWRSVHIEECTHGAVYTWSSVHMEECTQKRKTKHKEEYIQKRVHTKKNIRKGE